MTDNKSKTNYGALSILIIVFFFWGFMAAGNSIFIPFCKHYFNLDQFQSQLIDFAFYLAYYVGALILFAYSVIRRNDFIARFGYKKSIVFGLLFSAVGAAAMIFAVSANSFMGMLIGLFIVALGFSLQQTAANPFAIALGPPATGASRINLCGGLNSFGTAIGPIIVALLLFGTTAAISEEEIANLEISKVEFLYGGVGVLFLIAAAIFFFVKKLPNEISNEKTEKSNKALITLIVMTVLLTSLFVPVFLSYTTQKETKLSTQTQCFNEFVDGFSYYEYDKNTDCFMIHDSSKNMVCKAIFSTDDDNNPLLIKLSAEKDTIQKIYLIDNSSKNSLASVESLDSLNGLVIKDVVSKNIYTGSESTKSTMSKVVYNRLDKFLKDIEKNEMFRVLLLFATLVVVFITLLFAKRFASKNSEGWGAMKYPQLVFGMLAIFVYVGVEVSTVSNFGELLQKPDFGGFAANEVAPFISMYWGSLMIGRWTGAVAAFEFKSVVKKILTIVVPLVAFGVVLGVNAISQYSIIALLPYIALIAIQIAAFFLTKNKPARTLFVFAVLAACMMIAGICFKGMFSVYTIMAGGLFCSIMWSSIFNLALAGLGKYTTHGSAFLVMMILGGAVIPPIQGKLADYMQTLSETDGFGIHYSYVIPVLCFAFLAFFAMYVKRILKKQGIDYDSEV